MGLRTRLRRWAVVVRHGVSGEGGKESGRRVGGLALDARRGGICRVENEVEGAVGHDAKRARDDGEQVERKRSRACLCNRLLINSAIDANSILAWRRCRPPSRKPRFPLDSIRNNCALSWVSDTVANDDRRQQLAYCTVLHIHSNQGYRHHSIVYQPHTPTSASRRITEVGSLHGEVKERMQSVRDTEA